MAHMAQVPQEIMGSQRNQRAHVIQYRMKMKKRLLKEKPLKVRNDSLPYHTFLLTNLQ